MMSVAGVDSLMGKLSLMAYFPGDENFRAALIDELGKIVSTDEQGQWLAYRANQIFTKGWPGIGELRALFCKRFKPNDGIEVVSASHPEGFPNESILGPVPIVGLLLARTEREALQSATIPESHRLTSALPDDIVASFDPEAEKLVIETAETKSMPNVPKNHEPAGDEKRVDDLLRVLYNIPIDESKPTPTSLVFADPYQAEPRRERTTRPPQIISAEEVEAARQAELLRRKRA